MGFFNLSFWQNFISSGLATLVGVIIGIPAALWIGRIQERATEKEKKKKSFSL
jgi:ABC-type spermidine/putrescine transport system permease subunit I